MRNISVPLTDSTLMLFVHLKGSSQFISITKKVISTSRNQDTPTKPSYTTVCLAITCPLYDLGFERKKAHRPRKETPLIGHLREMGLHARLLQQNN